MSKWEIVKLGDCFSLSSGKFLPTKNRVTGDFNVYGGNGITGKHNEYFIDDPTVVVGRVGEYCGSVYLTEENVWVTDNALYVTKFLKIIDRKYICYALNAKNLNSYANKSGQPSISQSAILNIEIALPPLETQKQIAKTLDTAAELLAMRNQQLAELDNLIKSTFYDMFGDPVANEKGWEVKKLSQIGDVNRGVSKHRPRNEPSLLGGGHPLIQTGDVANADFIIREYKQTYSDLGLKQSKKWGAGTLCITIAANIAKTAIMGFDACFPDSVVGFNANKLSNNIFVLIWFGFFQKIIESQAPESAQKNINLRILNDLDVILPPIELQNQFANIVTKIEEQKTLVKKAIDETQYLLDSLMSEYFE